MAEMQDAKAEGKGAAGSVAVATEVDHDIIEQGGERREGGDDVGVGGGAEGADGHAVVARGGDAGRAQPGGGAAAGVNLDGERDEGKEGGQGKETDADEEQANDTTGTRAERMVSGP